MYSETLETTALPARENPGDDVVVHVVEGVVPRCDDPDHTQGPVSMQVFAAVTERMRPRSHSGMWRNTTQRFAVTQKNTRRNKWKITRSACDLKHTRHLIARGQWVLPAVLGNYSEMSAVSRNTRCGGGYARIGRIFSLDVTAHSSSSRADVYRKRPLLWNRYHDVHRLGVLLL